MKYFQENFIKPEEEKIIEIVNIYSGDRNRSIFQDPNSYTIKLMDSIGKNFKNVTNIRLISGVLPDKNNITHNPFLVLKINELESLGMTGSNNALMNGSAVLQFDTPVTAGYFLNLRTDVSVSSGHSSFSQPLAELSRLTISIVDVNNRLFNFGTDTGPLSPPDISLQHLFTFEISYIVKKRELQNLV